MRIPVYVSAEDPVSEIGVATQLRGRPETRVVSDLEIDTATVAVVVVDQLGDAAYRLVRAVQRNGCPKVILVVTKLDEAGLLGAIEAGACALLRRTEATPERLAATVESVSKGEGAVPADLLGRLLDQVGQLQRNVLAPQGLTFSGLSEREIEVLRLVAEGLDTAEIASRMSYSERTVKNVIHDVTSRLKLRNRSHAVAYAMREGLI